MVSATAAAMAPPEMDSAPPGPLLPQVEERMMADLRNAGEEGSEDYI